jgi:hypothetical protein
MVGVVRLFLGGTGRGCAHRNQGIWTPMGKRLVPYSLEFHMKMACYSNITN